jgi:hypothetical protein
LASTCSMPQAFLNVGGIEQVLAKAKALQENV